jgi:rod shape determining protein RodA
VARRNKLWSNVDWVTILVFLVLTLLGWINIYAAVYDDAHKSIFDLSQRYGKQLLWIGAALLIALFILVTEANFYVYFTWLFYGIVAFVLILVLIFGVVINGSRSWFIMGDFWLQPSEFAKFSTSLAVAKLVSGFNFRLSSYSSMLKTALIILLPTCLILMQPDVGSALVFISFLLVLFREGLSGVILFFGMLTVILFLLTLLLPVHWLLIVLYLGALLSHFFLNQKTKLISIALGITTAVTLLIWVLNMVTGSYLELEYVFLCGIIPTVIGFAVWVYREHIKRTMVVITVFFASLLFTYSVDFVFDSVLEKHHRDRINELLGIKSDPLGAGYNVNQSKIAIGSGGFLGKGFLNGTQTKFDFVPAQSTDFIFCTVGEEWGFVGSLVVIALFVFLCIRLIILAERQRSKFSRIYGYSVATILFFHVLVNIGMTIGLMPVIGIPLPFFSYGGSSLWSFTILLFIFLRFDASRLDKLV